MPDRCSVPFAMAMVLAALMLCAGCTTSTIGDIAYENGTLLVPITCTGETGDMFIQVTVYRIADFHQEELASVQQPVTLVPGENRVSVPLPLSPGTYKLYIYILTPGGRQTATIRDIVV